MQQTLKSLGKTFFIQLWVGKRCKSLLLKTVSSPLTGNIWRRKEQKAGRGVLEEIPVLGEGLD